MGAMQLRCIALSILLLAISCSAANRFFQDNVFLKPYPVVNTLGKPPYPGFPDLPDHPFPFAGNGTCGEKVVNLADGTTIVRCLGPAHSLAPGQTVDVVMYLESPYPKEGKVEVLNMTTQIVDGDGTPVALSDVYVHHYVTSSQFLLSSGAELRGSFRRRPLERPYAMVVDTANILEKIRFANIVLINSMGVAEADMRKCLECWCKDEPDHGSFLCCQDCPTTMDGPAVDYYFEYVVTYRPLAENAAVVPVDFISLDITGGKSEYDILASQGPGTTLRKVWDGVIDNKCPQDAPFQVVRCTGHQHEGGECMSLYNLDNGGELICRSCPVFGTQHGVPGDEDTYVVAMADGDLPEPYVLQPGARVRLISDYSAAERRLGVMGLMSVWAAGISSGCAGQLGYTTSGMMAQPAVIY